MYIGAVWLRVEIGGGCRKSVEILETLSDYQLLKKDSAPRN
jgi:hypothetical protein